MQYYDVLVIWPDWSLSVYTTLQKTSGEAQRYITRYCGRPDSLAGPGQVIDSCLSGQKQWPQAIFASEV